jgi:hypothetical protein
MPKWVTCGATTNPKTSKEYLRFSSKEDYQTEEKAQEIAQQWREENRYPFIWVERIGK